jgi:hypothetical protein
MSDAAAAEWLMRAAIVRAILEAANPTITPQPQGRAMRNQAATMVVGRRNASCTENAETVACDAQSVC